MNFRHFLISNELLQNVAGEGMEHTRTKERKMDIERRKEEGKGGGKGGMGSR